MRAFAKSRERSAGRLHGVRVAVAAVVCVGGRLYFFLRRFHIFPYAPPTLNTQPESLVKESQPKNVMDPEP